MFDKLDSALGAGLLKAVFDHIKNYLTCAFILAVGTNELKQQTSHFFGLVQSSYSGVGVISIACILIMLNLYDGIRQITVFRYHNLMAIVLVAIYVFMSIRVVEMVWNFRVAY